MLPTRRLWAVLGLAVALAAVAVLLDRLLPLLGAVLVGVWVLTRQYQFVRETRRFVDDVSVTQSPARQWLRTDESIPVTLSATIDRPSRLACTVEGGLPTGATATDAYALDLAPGSSSARATADVRWPIAGQHTFRKPTVSMTDGLFHQSLATGETPSVTVEPPGPRNVHVGAGGEQFAAAYGEHDVGRHGSGIEPAELREYLPGDTVQQIDWNATARLGTPYVREFEAETDRTTLLVVDHRNALSLGPPGETKLAYLREVALGIATSASQLDDPLGLLTVGDGGITTEVSPATTGAQYTEIRRRLLDLEPTAAGEATVAGETTATGEPTPAGEATTAVEAPTAAGEATTAAGAPTPISESTPAPPAAATGGSPRGISTPSVPESPIARRGAPQTTADVEHSLAALAGDGPFDRTVRPFYADRQRYRHRIASEPLFGAVRRSLATSRGSVLTVLCTDDSAPVELRETVQLARTEGGQVLVLLAPTVLYEPGGLSDVERAYDRYVRFEELRRELSQADGVTALEVGPGDRLSTLLAAGRGTRQSVGGGRL